MASEYSWVYFEDKMEVVRDKVIEIHEFYNWTLSIADKRVADWPLMDGISQTLALSGLYLLIVWLGPIYMQNKKPFNFRWTLVIYNLMLIILNFHIASEIFFASRAANYSYLCQSVSYSYDQNEMRIAKAIWWFYISKLLEMLDTFFFILRKKNSQITFLHVYHHVTMFPIWWIGTKWVAGGQSFLGAMLNSLVHILMYSYYGLSAIGPSVYPYLWWKKYLTIIQLIQFIFGMCHAVQSLVSGCNFPVWMHWALIFYGGSLLLLFLNFYHKSYLNKKNKSSQNASVSCNGLPHTEDTSNNTIPSSPLSRDTILRRRSLHPHDHQ